MGLEVSPQAGVGRIAWLVFLFELLGVEWVEGAEYRLLSIGCFGFGCLLPVNFCPQLWAPWCLLSVSFLIFSTFTSVNLKIILVKDRHMYT